jgi:hypothetical protein
MTVIHRHMSSIYCAMCLNMLPTSLVWWMLGRVPMGGQTETHCTPSLPVRDINTWLSSAHNSAKINVHKSNTDLTITSMAAAVWYLKEPLACM